MKRFFHAVLVLPSVLFAAACSDNDGDEAVKLESGTDVQQQFFADDTAPAPIRFTATAAWTATVAETAPVQTKTEAGRIDWLSLNRYSGEAGEVALTMTLLPNNTGSDRRAEIRIACGGTSISIAVEQKGTKQDGSKPQDPEKPDDPEPANYALVARIDVEFNGWSELPYYERQYDLNLYPDPSNMYFAFRYDDRKRIVEYEKAVYYADEPEIVKLRSGYKFDYSVEGEIQMVDTETELTEPVVPFRVDSENFITHTIRLDARNRAVRFISGDEMTQSHYFYTYNDEGRLSRIETSHYLYDKEGEEHEVDESVELTYRNGVVSDSTHYRRSYEEYTTAVPESTFSEYPNDRISIDPNHLYASYSDIVFDVVAETEHNRCTLPLLRLTGKGSDRLLAVRKTCESKPDYSIDTPYTTPNVTIPASCEDFRHISPRELHYTFNEDGTIACITEEETWIRMQYEYDIVVGSELLYPNIPEMGYNYTINEKKATESARGKDIYKYTFTYCQ